MWEKEGAKLWLKILLAVIIIALLAGLYVGYRFVSEKEAAQDAALLEVYAQHQQEQYEAKQANYDDVAALYQVDLDAIAQFLPGIVCWGDALTAGSAGGVSYPGVLKELIDASIVDRYDFRGTLEDSSGLSKIKWEDYTIDIPVVNMGSGRENSASVLGRNGAVPYAVKNDFVIPAGCESVSLSLISSSGEKVTPLTQGDVGVNPVSIAGIEGTLSLDLEKYSRGYFEYSFTRSAPGAEVPVSAGTEIITAGSDLYRDYVPVIFLGTFDSAYGSVDSLISAQKAIIDHQIANKDRYVILGPFYFAEMGEIGMSNYLEQFENAMLQEYGNHFINVRKYLMSDGLSDAKLSPTAQDTKDIKNGLVPSSLRSSAEASELNATGYTLLGRLVYNRMDKLGYFDEVKDELGITALEKLDRQEELKK